MGHIAVFRASSPHLFSIPLTTLGIRFEGRHRSNMVHLDKKARNGADRTRGQRQCRPVGRGECRLYGQ